MVKACNAPPYTGGEPFIFVHYSRADEGEAFTLTEQLAARGFRVYYAWEEAACRLNARLSECTALVALYSPEAAQDHHFRKVITSAVLSRKPVVPVFLEDFALSPGMKAQLERHACMSRYPMLGDLSPFEHLDGIACARGEPNPAVCVEQRAPRIRNRTAPTGGEERRCPFSTMLVDEEEILKRMKEEPPARPCSRTVIIGEEAEAAPNMPASGTERGRHGTLILEEIPPVCVFIPKGERVAGQYGLTRIGRSEACDIQVPEYTVSSQHLEVFSFADADGSYRNTLVDCHSSNGTWVNGKRIVGGEPLSVGSHASVSLGRNVHLFFAFGREAQALARRDVLYSLECAETRMLQVLCEDEIVLGRCDPFGNGFFDFPQISWGHARLRCTPDRCTITDQSSNGTRVNGKKIAKYSEFILKDGDEISMGYHRYVLRRITLQEGCAS